MKLFYIAILSLLFAVPGIATAQSNPEQATEDPQYEEAKKKLTELYLLELDSESHKKSSELIGAFMSKMNFSGTPETMSNLYRENKVIEWIKENFQNTSFSSLEEAQKDFDTMMKATEDSIEDNREYHDFMMQSVVKYGAKILIEVNEYVMYEHPEKLGIRPECVRR